MTPRPNTEPESAVDALRRIAETADALKAKGYRVRVDVKLTMTMPAPGGPR
jgi:hypothetical protein